MQFKTDVELPSGGPFFSHRDRFLLLGSCFADNIGERLQTAGFRTDVNPFGTLYNPLSVASALERLLTGTPFTADELTSFAGEGWGAWTHHSRFSRPDAVEAIEAMNASLRRSSTLLHEGCVLAVTLGSAWVYRLRETGRVVANCHRQPEAMFERSLLSVDDIVEVWEPLIHRLIETVPDIRILFTISPIRHLRDGAHGNAISKATLLLAVERLCRIFSEKACLTFGEKTSRTFGENQAVTYFPAYEILLDELRDYRFYADDMVHPSSLAVDYLWERFSDAYFDASTRALIARWEEVKKALAHRPFRPDSDEYRRFIRQTMLKIEEIQKEFPYFDAAKEIAQCHTLLNN